jgi:CHAT domain-containing protein
MSKSDIGSEPAADELQRAGTGDPELDLEMQRINLQGHFAAMVMKEEVDDRFDIVSRVLYLPVDFLLRGLTQGGLSQEVIAVGLMQTIDALRPHGPTKLLASSILSRARCLRTVAPPDTVLPLILEAVMIYEQLGKVRDLGRAFVVLGTALRDSGLVYDALLAYDKARIHLAAAEDGAGLAAVDYNCGVVYRKFGLPEEALLLLRRAKRSLPSHESGETWERLISLESIQAMQAAGLDAEAIAAMEEYLPEESDQNARAKSESAPGVSYAFALRARLRRRVGNKPGALEDYRAAVECAYLEIINNKSLQFRSARRAELDVIYQEALLVAIETHDVDSAIQLLERSKTAYAVDSDANAPEGSAPDEDSEIFLEANKRFQDSLAQLTTDAETAVRTDDRNSMRECQERAEWLLAQRSIGMSSSANKVGLPDWSALRARAQAALPRDALVLEYAVVDRCFWLFAITGNNLEIYPIEVEGLAIAMLTKSFPFECESLLPMYALTRLANILLAPVMNALPNYQIIIVVPPRELAGIPFHAMVLNNQPLIASHQVLYVASIQQLAPRKQRAHPYDFSSDDACAILCVPSVPYAAVAMLPGALREAAAVRSVFRTSQYSVDDQATSRQLFQSLREAKILHLACHAQFNAAYPLLSRLLLWDRPVFAFELLSATRVPKFVYLSACQTGEAVMRLGGEVQGLADAFVAAGAQNTLATWWELDDQSGEAFTHAFYNLLLGSGACPPWIASRAAQLQLRDIKDREHPYFWAPFIVSGTLSIGQSA